MPSIMPPPSATSDRETTVYSEVRTDLKVKVTSNVNKYGKCSSLLEEYFLKLFLDITV